MSHGSKIRAMFDPVGLIKDLYASFCDDIKDACLISLRGPPDRIQFLKPEDNVICSCVRSVNVQRIWGKYRTPLTLH